MKTADPSITHLILYGTETGTAEELAECLAERMQNNGIVCRLENMANISFEEVCEHKSLFVLVSTWGEGEPPEDAEVLYEALQQCGEDTLVNVDFAVFGLGDSGYEDFCQCGIDFDKMLEAAGGARLLERVDADIDYEDPFEVWSADVLASCQSMLTACE